MQRQVDSILTLMEKWENEKSVEKYHIVRQNEALIVKISTQSLFAILIFFSLTFRPCKKTFLRALTSNETKKSHYRCLLYFVSIFQKREMHISQNLQG